MSVLSMVKRVSVAVLHNCSQFKLTHNLLALKDCQGHSFKPSMLPILGTWDSIYASWRKRSESKQDFQWLQCFTYADSGCENTMGFHLSDASYVIIIATQVPGLWNVNVGHVLDYCGTINSFISRNKDLHALELSNANWESIKLVASWLKLFQSATMKMSTIKLPMLSMTHVIFWGL
jgi:hypothetical protein